VNTQTVRQLKDRLTWVPVADIEERAIDAAAHTANAVQADGEAKCLHETAIKLGTPLSENEASAT